MKHTHRMLRSIGTSLVALFLIAGASFATTAFVGGRHTATTVPAAQELATDALETDEVETEEPTETD